MDRTHVMDVSLATHTQTHWHSACVFSELFSFTCKGKAPEERGREGKDDVSGTHVFSYISNKKIICKFKAAGGFYRPIRAPTHIMETANHIRLKEID